jgi:hypothetical protein
VSFIAPRAEVLAPFEIRRGVDHPIEACLNVAERTGVNVQLPISRRLEPSGIESTSSFIRHSRA